MSTYYPGEENDSDNINNNLVYVQSCEGILLNVINGVDCACESRWCFKSRQEIHKCKYNLSTEPDEITKIPKECTPCEDSCSICLDILDTCCVITKCKHKFHEKCISKYFKTAPRKWFGHVNCPMCRGRVWPATFMELNKIFEKYKNCNCCSRHKVNRPKTLMPLSTGRVQWCINKKRSKNNTLREFNCECPCRHILRWNCCRRLY